MASYSIVGATLARGIGVSGSALDEEQAMLENLIRRRSVEGGRHETVAKATKTIRAFNKKIADENVAALGLQEELSVALCFDVSVQNFGLKQSEVTQLHQATVGKSEKEKRQLIAELVADRSKPRFRKDVLDRKLSFVDGAGTVHGDQYELDGWGLA